MSSAENKHVANADEEKKTLKCNAADNLIASILPGAKVGPSFIRVFALPVATSVQAFATTRR